MSDSNRFNRHHKKMLAVVFFGSLVCACLAAEWVLGSFWPARIKTIGHVFSPNGQRYGWGWNPHELIKVVDPDSGEVYTSRANNHGWRDRDRSYENPGGSFRILVLGDSNTFGAIVPADKLYTRVLEDGLRQDHYNVEVIAMGYSGWGTDQALEAIKREGLKYRPNLVVMQFCSNDLTDNLPNPTGPPSKPFCYKLDDRAQLVRSDEPKFDKGRSGLWRHLLLRSEICKRGYSLVHKEVIPFHNPIKVERTARQNNRTMLQLELQLPDDNPLMVFLSEQDGKPLDEKALRAKIDAGGVAEHSEVILRVLEDRWIHHFWLPACREPIAADPESLQYRTYFALVREAKRLVEASGGRLAIFCDEELGKFQFERFWCRVEGSERARENYLSSTRLVRNFCIRENIGFIESPHPHTRARNDPHPNIEGNQAMAANVRQYLMATRRKAIVARRSAALY